MMPTLSSEGFGSRFCLRCNGRENVVCEVCFAPYCSTECQRLDWPMGHVVHCKPVPGSIPSSTLQGTFGPNTRASRAPNGLDTHLFANGPPPPRYSAGSSSRSDSGERTTNPWAAMVPSGKSGGSFRNHYGEKGLSSWSSNSGLMERKSYMKMDSDPLTSTLNGAAPVWRPKAAANFMGIPDSIWNDTIKSEWPATEAKMKITVLAMGAQCSGFFDFSGIIDATPEQFMILQQLEIDAANYCERVKEAYIPSAGDFVLAKFDGMFYRAVAVNHKKVWFMDYGNFAEVSPLDVRKMPSDLMEVTPCINLFKFVGIKPAVGEVFDEESRQALVSDWQMMMQVEAVCKGLDETGRIIAVEVPTMYKQFSEAGVIRLV